MYRGAAKDDRAQRVNVIRRLIDRVTDAFRQSRPLRIAAPAVGALAILGIVLGVTLTGGPDPETGGPSGQSVDIAEPKAGAATETGDRDAGTTAPAEPAATAAADDAATDDSGTTAEQTGADAPQAGDGSAPSSAEAAASADAAGGETAPAVEAAGTGADAPQDDATVAATDSGMSEDDTATTAAGAEPDAAQDAAAAPEAGDDAVAPGGDAASTGTGSDAPQDGAMAEAGTGSGTSRDGMAATGDGEASAGSDAASAGSDAASADAGSDTPQDAAATSATGDEAPSHAADAGATQDATGSGGDQAAGGEESAAAQDAGAAPAEEGATADAESQEVTDGSSAAAAAAGDDAAGAGDDAATTAASADSTEGDEPLAETRVVPDEAVEPAPGDSAAADDAGQTPAGAEPGDAPTPPSFDLARIKPDGSAVIAGRAAPGADVTVRSDSIELGSETADGRGEWVLVPNQHIPAGDHEFWAVATLPDGRQVESEHSLVVSVPDLDAGEDAGSLLAVLVPRDGDGKSTVLQQPTDLAALDDEGGGASQPGDEARPSDEVPLADEAQPGDAERTVAADQPGDAAQTDAVGDGGVPSDDAAASETAVAAAGDGETAPGEASDGDETTAEAGADAEAEPAQAAADEPEEGLEDGSLAVGTVDYDEEGDIVIAGKAEPEATVNVYVDDEHVGTAETSEQGEWEVDPGDEVEPGTHTLRVDQVDQAGVVLARIETPLVRASPEELSLGDAIVVVQPGNSLWRIARRTLGGGVHFTLIYEANRSQITDPALIYPGQIFTVPERDGG